MRRVRRVIGTALAGAVVVGGAAAVVGPAVAAGTALPVVSQAQVSGTGAVTLAKDQVRIVTLTLRMVCDPGAGCDAATVFGPVGDPRPIFLDVQRPSGTPSIPLRYTTTPLDDNGYPQLTRTSGTAADGLYRASFPVTAAQNGSYTLARIGFSGLGWRSPGLAPEAAVVRVTGHDPVIVRSHVDPGAVRPVGEVTTVVDYLVQTRDSGHARGGWTVTVCLAERGCGDLGEFRPTYEYLTRENGMTPWFRWSFGSFTGASSADTATLLRTITVYGTSTRYAVGTAAVAPTVQSTPSTTWVNARASTATAAVGAAVTLSGSVGGNGTPTRPDTVRIQRWVNGAWLDLGRAIPLVNGRWSYLTVPQQSGAYRYRVIKPTNACAGNTCMSPQAVSSTVAVTVR